MGVPKRDSSSRPACGKSPFLVSRYVAEYTNHLDASRFTDRRANDSALTVRDRHRLLCNTDAGTCVKRPSPRGGRGMFAPRCVGSQARLSPCVVRLVTFILQNASSPGLTNGLSIFVAFSWVDTSWLA